MKHYTNEEEAKSKRTLAEKLKTEEEKVRENFIKNRPRYFGLQVEPTASYYDDAEKREPGDQNWKGFGFDIQPQVTLISSLILALFISFTLFNQNQASEIFNSLFNNITSTLGWFLILAVNFVIIAVCFFAFSRMGKIKIGGKDAVPEFSTLAWFSMLLSAGMGIGLMFWSVGEPISHLVTPSPLFNGIAPETPEAAQAAMGVTFFHWGFHPWAIYALMGLALAFFSFNRGLPLTIRSIFYPLLGERIYGRWGHLIDILSVMATLTGLATSLGFGVQQLNAGLHSLFDISISTNIQIILIASITGLATLSVITGLDKGVKILSELNMSLAGIFMLFLLIVGPSVYILSGMTQNFGFYLSKLPLLSFWTETFKDTSWQKSWTTFYWAWWISWAPFVGMFIARISKGRTVREFILGVIIIPSLLTFLWMSVFGGAALNIELAQSGVIKSAVQENVATALFVLLKNFPFQSVLSFIAMILVTIFFVTSSDSGSLVVDHLTSGGKLDSPVPQRVFWALMEGVVAIILLMGGGLSTLQTAAVCTGLPFSLILLLSIYSLFVEFKSELYVEDAVDERLKEVESEHYLTEIVENNLKNSQSK